MNILAIDTAAEVLSVALEAGTGVWYTEIDAGTRHSELLMECADSLCKLAGLPPEKIELAACMKGPGSFTGLRIGFAAAKGLALALGIPLLTAPTLDCLARPLSVWPGLVLPVLDAKKNRFFAALYRGEERLTDYTDAPAETLVKKAEDLALFPGEPVILTGQGAALCHSRILENHPSEFIKLDPGYRRGNARELLNFIKHSKLEEAEGSNSGPVYIRKSDAELNR